MYSLVSMMLSFLLIFANATPEHQALLKDLKKMSSWQVIKVHSSGTMTIKSDDTYEAFLNLFQDGFPFNAEFDNESVSTTSEISYDLEGYIDFVNKQAYIEGTLKNDDYPKGEKIKAYLNDGYIYMPKDYLVKQYPEGVFELARGEYIAYPYEVEQMALFNRDFWSELERYKPIGEKIGVGLPISQSDHTYTLKLDENTLGGLFEKIANKVIDNRESLVKQYLEVDKVPLVGSTYDDKTDDYKDVTYDNVEAYYEQELKQYIDQTVDYIKNNHLIERMTYFIKGYCYGTSVEIITTVNDTSFSNQIKGHLQFLKGNVLDIEVETIIVPSDQQKITLPTSVEKVENLWDYTHAQNEYFRADANYTLDKAKDMLKEGGENVEEYAFTDGKDYYLPLSADRNWCSNHMIYYDAVDESCYLLERDNFDEKAYTEARYIEAARGEIDNYQEPDVADYIIDKSKLYRLEGIQEDGYCLVSIKELERFGFYAKLVEEGESNALVIYENPFN